MILRGPTRHSECHDGGNLENSWALHEISGQHKLRIRQLYDFSRTFVREFAPPPFLLSVARSSRILTIVELPYSGFQLNISEHCVNHSELRRYLHFTALQLWGPEALFLVPISWCKMPTRYEVPGKYRVPGTRSGTRCLAPTTSSAQVN